MELLWAFAENAAKVKESNPDFDIGQALITFNESIPNLNPATIASEFDFRRLSSLTACLLGYSSPILEKTMKHIEKYNSTITGPSTEEIPSGLLQDVYHTAEFYNAFYTFFRFLSRHVAVPQIFYSETFLVPFFQTLELSTLTGHLSRNSASSTSSFPSPRDVSAMVKDMRTVGLVFFQNMSILGCSQLQDLFESCNEDTINKRTKIFLSCCSRTILPSLETENNTSRNFIFDVRDGCAALRSLLFLCSSETLAKKFVREGLLNACFLFFLQVTGLPVSEDLSSLHNFVSNTSNGNAESNRSPTLPWVNLGYSRTFDLFTFLSKGADGALVREATVEALRTLQITALHISPEAMFQSVNTQLCFDFFTRLSSVLSTPSFYSAGRSFDSIEWIKAADSAGEFPEYDATDALTAALDSIKLTIPSYTEVTSLCGTSDNFLTCDSSTWMGLEDDLPLSLASRAMDAVDSFAPFSVSNFNPTNRSVYETVVFAAKCIGFCPPSHASLLCASSSFPAGLFTMLAAVFSMLTPQPSTLSPRGLYNLSNDDLAEYGGMVINGFASLLRNVPGLRDYIAIRLFGPLLDSTKYPPGGESGDIMIPVGAASEKELDHVNNATLRARVLLSMLHYNAEVAQGAGQLVYVLSGQNVEECNRLAGVGRAAGVLAVAGITSFPTFDLSRDNSD